MNLMVKRKRRGCPMGTLRWRKLLWKMICLKVCSSTSYLCVVETEDLSTLQYLLDVQLDIQQRIIDGVLEHLNKSNQGIRSLAVVEEEEKYLHFFKFENAG
jgi:hypothetical protein